MDSAEASQLKKLQCRIRVDLLEGLEVSFLGAQPESRCESSKRTPHKTSVHSVTSVVELVCDLILTTENTEETET